MPRSALFGVALPAAPNTAARGAAWTALWLGPTSWLLVATRAPQPPPISTARARRAQRRRRRAVRRDRGASAWTIAGAHAATVLAKGCPLDFHPRAFRPGTARRACSATSMRCSAGAPRRVHAAGRAELRARRVARAGRGRAVRLRRAAAAAIRPFGRGARPRRHASALRHPLGVGIPPDEPGYRGPPDSAAHAHSRTLSPSGVPRTEGYGYGHALRTAQDVLPAASNACPDPGDHLASTSASEVSLTLWLHIPPGGISTGLSVAARPSC